MATSRYDSPTTTGSSRDLSTGGGGTLNTSGNSSTQGNQSGNSDTQQSGNSHTEQNTSSSTSSQNMSGSSLAALELLIQQLLGGGTQEMAQQRAQRQGVTNQTVATQAGYTKEAAFNDAQGLMAQTMRTTLESLLPGINRAAAGAGTSQNSMRALLTQKAAEEAAQAASAQGLNAAVQYGNLNSNFASVLERLTTPDNSTTNALLQALNTARGAVTSSTTSGSSITDQQTDSSTQQQSQSNSNSNQQTNSNQTANGGRVSAGGGGSTTGNPTNVDGLVYYGPQTSTGSLQQTANNTGSTLDTLLQLAGGGGGGNDSFGDFTF